jgi:phosphatidylethanolamine-binding protein (PEBP) family uncharacterized protein
MRMATRVIGATPILAALAALVLSGCSNSANGSATTAAPPAQVTLTSSAIHGSKLPALYTCDGRDISPPLSWGALPSGVEEVAIFALGAHHNAEGKELTSVEWAIAGVKPGLHTLQAGQIPHGAFVLAASDGKRHYSICPDKGQTLHYTFAIYALPHDARVTAAISSLQLLVNLNRAGSPEDQTPATGLLAVSYTRR